MTGRVSSFGRGKFRSGHHVLGRVVFLIFLLLSFSIEARAQEISSHEKFPGATFLSLEGNPVEMFGTGDSVIFLNFWGTWCGPCLEEIPDLIKLARDLGPEGLNVVGVAVESGSFDTIQAFIQERGINYLVVMGDMDQVKNKFQVHGFPSSLLIDHAGVVRKRYFGPQSLERLRLDILPLLSVSVPNH